MTIAKMSMYYPDPSCNFLIVLFVLSFLVSILLGLTLIGFLIFTKRKLVKVLIIYFIAILVNSLTTSCALLGQPFPFSHYDSPELVFYSFSLGLLLFGLAIFIIYSRLRASFKIILIAVLFCIQILFTVNLVNYTRYYRPPADCPADTEQKDGIFCIPEGAMFY